MTERGYQNVLALSDVQLAFIILLLLGGVGGFRVPLDTRHETADLARALALPVVLVVGVRLGCINHALLTAEAIVSRGRRLAGWVANIVDPAMRFAGDNVETIHAWLEREHGTPLLGTVPHLAPPSAETAAAHLDIAALLRALRALRANTL